MFQMEYVDTTERERDFDSQDEGPSNTRILAARKCAQNSWYHDRTPAGIGYCGLFLHGTIENQTVCEHLDPSTVVVVDKEKYYACKRFSRPSAIQSENAAAEHLHRMQV